MSIRQHIEDARFLWSIGRKESAMLLAVVAAAGAARREFPQLKGDREAFQAFVKRIRPYGLSVHYKGKLRPIEELLYKWLRCVLVHEAEWPIDIEFIPNPAPGLSTIRAAGGARDTLQLSESWFHDLVYIILEASKEAGDSTNQERDNPA